MDFIDVHIKSLQGFPEVYLLGLGFEDVSFCCTCWKERALSNSVPRNEHKGGVTTGSPYKSCERYVTKLSQNLHEELFVLSSPHPSSHLVLYRRVRRGWGSVGGWGSDEFLLLHLSFLFKSLGELFEFAE